MADFWDRFRGILRASKVFGGRLGRITVFKVLFFEEFEGARPRVALEVN